MSRPLVRALGFFLLLTTAFVRESAAQSGRISGTVTAKETGTTLSGVVVRVYNPSGSQVTSATTAADGVYITPAVLATGTYYAKTTGTSSYVGQLYSNLACVAGSCSATTGTPIAVTTGETKAGIDFVLAPGGAFTGTVTPPAGYPSSPSGIPVYVYSETGTNLGSTAPNSAGKYTTAALPAGTYFAGILGFTGNYMGQLFDGLYCGSSCDPTSGTPITVTVGLTTPGIDFVLKTGGSVAGSVTNESSGLPIQGASVTIYSATGGSAAWATTDSHGAYKTSGLAQGSYYAKVTAATFLSELYNEVPCPPGCVATSGTPIVVGDDEAVSGIDFALALGGSITGRVTGKDTGLGVAGVAVSVRDGQGNYVGSATTDHLGDYTVTGLWSGPAYVLAYGTSTYVGQLYKGLACTESWCVPAFGTPVPVSAGKATPGIDFVLGRTGSIGGSVTGAGGVPVSNVQVVIYNAGGVRVTSEYTDAGGDYLITLAPGTYFAQAQATDTLMAETYNELPCANALGSTCDVTLGTPIVVTAGHATTGIDFTLSEPPGGRITGTITQSGGTPLSGVSVYVRDDSGATRARATSDSGGSYVVMGLATGTYWVLAFPSSAYLGELYDNVPCPSGQCSLTAGTPVDVTYGATRSGVDFALGPGGSIEGRVTQHLSRIAVSGARVVAYSAAGQWIASDSSDAEGSYRIEGLRSGNYYVRTENTPGYVDEAYDGVSCPLRSCSVTAGTSVKVAEGSATSGINFTLLARAISGSVTDASSHAAVANIEVTLHNLAGTELASVRSDYAGQYVTPGLPLGTYHLRAGKDGEYLAEAYDNVPCDPTCDITSATRIVVGTGVGPSGIDFALVPTGAGAASGAVAGFVTDGATGRPVAGVRVDAIDVPTGYSRDSTTSVNGFYTIASLEPGSYRVVAGGAGYVAEAYDNVTCPDRYCNGVTAHVVTVTEDSVTRRIDFALARGGTIAGHVTRQATGDPVVGAYVRAIDATGAEVLTASSDASGYYRLAGLAPGKYYVAAASGTLNVVYPALVCGYLECNVRAGTLISIDGTETESGIDLAVPDAPVVTGRVTRSDDGEAIGGVAVQVLDAGRRIVGWGWTDEAGHYRMALQSPGGAVYVRTQNAPGLVDEFWDDAPCPPTCGPGGAAEPISVSPGSTQSGIDFALEPGGAIAGRVTDAVSGAGVGDVTVHVVHPGTGTIVRSQRSDATGAYQVRGLPPGTYRVRTAGSVRFVDELYDNLPRFTSLSSATPVIVAGVGTTSGIDFALERHPQRFTFEPRYFRWIDPGVFRRRGGTWRVRGRADVELGAAGDRVVSADYDGDGEIDLASFDPKTGAWRIEGHAPIVWGAPGDVPVPADYDGNGAADIAVYRPATGTWFVRDGLTQGYGLPGDVPVPADYDGDGVADLAVFRRSTGTWFIREVETAVWGAPGDWPVPADYDGDGRAELAVWRPSTGTWYVRGLGTWQIGAPGDVPVPLDFTRDGMAELAIYTPSSGRWLVYPWYDGEGDVMWWGGPGETPAWLPSWLQADAPGDEDGDQRADIKVYRPSTGTWFSLRSSTGFQTYSWRGWGVQAQGDVPAPGDYDGDGVLDPTVYRPAYGTWFTLRSSSDFTEYTAVGWGNATDVLVQGDYDGDGATDVAVYRPATFTWYVVPSSTGAGWDVVFGQAGDVPIPGDYDGDGKTDVAVYRPATGTWFWLKSSANRTQYDYRGWGVQAQQDTPVPGDYDGDGRIDPTVYRPAYGTWFVLMSSSDYSTYFAFGWGGASDVLMPADYDGDQVTDAAVYRPASGTWFVLKSSTGFSPGAPDGSFSAVFGQAGDVALPAR